MQMFQRPPFDNSFDQWAYTASYVMYVYIRISTATMKPRRRGRLYNTRVAVTAPLRFVIATFNINTWRASRLMQQIWASLTAAHKRAFVNHATVTASCIDAYVDDASSEPFSTSTIVDFDSFFLSLAPLFRNMFGLSFFLPGWMTSDVWGSLLGGALAIHI